MEEFVNVYLDKDDRTVVAGNKHDFYGEWANNASAKHSNPSLVGADALRRLYPNHSLVMTMDFRLNLLKFPGVLAVPLEDVPLVTNLVFIPLARSLGPLPGILIDQVDFGAFRLAWDTYDFLLFIVQYPSGFGTVTQSYILHEGTEAPARSLLVRAGSWADRLHDEIWVFNQGFWQKDHSLWKEIQKADWKDIILKPEFKVTLQKDVNGFFSSKKVYEELGIPWKRGLIMYGPPGNGKTISLKAIMKTCSDKDFTPLYVKSFQSYKGEEGGMADVFDKARQLSPCVIVLEDLDSLIDDRNRSFFLNQLDGLEGNDGLLIIGTTNHFDRLDPGLSARPSRFDRKFKFDDPDSEERTLYVRYWHKKLENNKEISFPEDLVKEIVETTKRFSFAYLKEAFVSTLVALATHEEGSKPSFAEVLRGQIKALSKQIDKFSFLKSLPGPSSEVASSNSIPRRPARPNNERDIHALLDALSDSIGSSRIFTTKPCSQESHIPNDSDFRLLLDTLSESVAKGDITSERAYSVLPSSMPSTCKESSDGTCLQPMRASQRISTHHEKGDLHALNEQSFHRATRKSNIADRTAHRDEIRLSQALPGSRSTPGEYSYPEFLSPGSNIWGP